MEDAALRILDAQFRRRQREPERISRTLLLMLYLPLVSSPPSLCRGLLAFASYFWLNAASLLPHLTKQSMTWVYLSRGGEGVGWRARVSEPDMTGCSRT